MKPLKNAHRDGHTHVCYDSSGSFILTGGSDGKVCIWEGRDDADTITVGVGEKVHALAFQGGRFFAATDENSIRIHTFPDGVSDGLVTRFTSPCRCFCISQDGSLLVAGADDFKIKVISLEESECICLFSEHKAPILSVSLDPTKEFAASASCDGSVKIWGIIDGTTEKSLDLLPKSNEIGQAKSLCQTCWSQDGEFLLIPLEKEILICMKSSWEVIKKLENQDITGTINTMVLSPDGMYLAFGCTNGDMGIYEWQNFSRLGDKHSHPKHLPITSMAWNPQNVKEIAFCDNMGQLGFLDAALGDEQTIVDGTAVEGTVFDDADDDMLVSGSGQVNGDKTDLDEINRFLDDPEDENSIDIGSIKRSLLPAEDNEDSASVASGKVEEQRFVQPPPPPALSLPPPQEPFQAGSTPEHLSSRFMVWNSVGIIRQYVSEDENSIDVEFHDTATHHALHIDNKNDFCMADISCEAVLLASRGLDDAPSKLLCMHFGSWDNHKEWSYDMPEGEKVQTITVSDRWAAVATSARCVRMFSIGGLQHRLFSLPGDAITLASSSDRLLVVYHKGVTSPQGDQSMGVYLMRIGHGCSTKVMINGDALPLSPSSKLAWAGFSDEGLPFCMDTAGVVRTFDRSYWVPVANTRQHAKGKSDHHWLVSVNAKQQQIRCVPCKGSRFPATLPRPALAVLPLQLPLCDPESEKSKYEETYERNSMVARQLSGLKSTDANEIETSVKEAVVKLFAFAAKSERDFRALEVCEMMRDQNLLQIAATYATRLRRIQLAERVSEYMHRRQEEEEEEEEEEEDHVNQMGEDDFVGGIKRERFGHSMREPDSENEDEVNMETEHPEAEKEDSQRSTGPKLVTKVQKQTSVERPVQRLNPFKVAGSAERKSLKGTQIFDKMEKATPKASPIFAPLPVSIKKSGKKASSSQPKLLNFKKEKANSVSKDQVKQEANNQESQEDSSENQPMKKKASAFDLWFEVNKEEVRDAHPEVSEEDLGQKAAEDFRALSKEERQMWVQKAKSANSSETADIAKKRKMSTDNADLQDGEKTGVEESKKVKREPDSGKKVPLSQATNAKLARFVKSD